MTESAMVCDGCHQANGHSPGCASRGRHQHHNSVPVDECLFHQEQQARIAAAVAAVAHRRETRARQRQQLDDARTGGLRTRHAAKVRAASSNPLRRP